MSYTLILTRTTLNDLDSVPLEISQRASSKIDSLAEVPRPKVSKKLKGAESIYRIRIGDWRVLYAVDDRIREIIIHRVSHRSEVYSKKQLESLN